MEFSHLPRSLGPRGVGRWSFSYLPRSLGVWGALWWGLSVKGCLWEVLRGALAVPPGVAWALGWEGGVSENRRAMVNLAGQEGPN